MAPGLVTIPLPLCEGAVGHRVREAPPQPRVGETRRCYRSFDVTEQYAGGAWTVRTLRGNAEGKVYTCPGCQQPLASALPHVVVWPNDRLGDVTDRRHWHTNCWSARDRRPPRGSWR